MTPTHIVVHHSVTPQYWDKQRTISNISDGHRRRGFPRSSSGLWVGYHKVIGHDWEYQTRPWTEQGAHAGAYWNVRAIGICLAGNFEVDNLAPKQEQFLVDTLQSLMDKYRIPRENILRHQDAKKRAGYGSTACPGRNISYEKIHGLLEDNNYDTDVMFNFEESVNLAHYLMIGRGPTKEEWARWKSQPHTRKTIDSIFEDLKNLWTDGKNPVPTDRQHLLNATSRVMRDGKDMDGDKKDENGKTEIERTVHPTAYYSKFCRGMVEAEDDKF